MKKKMTYVVVALAVVAVSVSVFSAVALQIRIDILQRSYDDLQHQLFKVYSDVTSVDRMGNVVTLEFAPERIVSLSPSITEILFALEAGEAVVGVTDSCDYPYNFSTMEASNVTREMVNVTRVGGVVNPAVEPIVELEPDLVLATTQSLETVEALQALEFNVLVIESRTVDEVLNDILLVGRVTGMNVEASALVSVMKAQIDVVANQATRAATTPKVYYEVQDNPLMSVGSGTIVDELIALAGGENIFNTVTESWPLVSPESVVEKNPDVMIFPDMDVDVDNFDETVAAVTSRSGWDSITAVQNGALYEVDVDLVSRGGPRIVEALILIARMVHPEIFGQP